VIRHEFEQHAGFRFFKDDISILLHAAARFKQTATVTSTDLYNYFRHLNKFLQSVGAYSPERQGVSELLTDSNFPALKNAEFFKFLPETSLDYYLKGSFQFGSIRYYRNIEAQNSKDAMEGLSNIAIKTPKHLIGVSLASGYNFGIFCGTSSLEKRREKSDRFGSRIIKIANLRQFAEDVQASLGAKKYYFNKVSYNDLKLFRANTLKSFDLSRPNAPNNNFDPGVIDKAAFDLLYDTSFLSSLFMKPTRFSVEQELRLVFEMPKDVPDVIRLQNPELAKHIEIVQ
jgi:hypothetical protein